MFLLTVRSHYFQTSCSDDGSRLVLRFSISNHVLINSFSLSSFDVFVIGLYILKWVFFIFISVSLCSDYYKDLKKRKFCTQFRFRTFRNLLNSAIIFSSVSFILAWELHILKLTLLFNSLLICSYLLILKQFFFMKIFIKIF